MTAGREESTSLSSLSSVIPASAGIKHSLSPSSSIIAGDQNMSGSVQNPERTAQGTPATAGITAEVSHLVLSTLSPTMSDHSSSTHPQQQQLQSTTLSPSVAQWHLNDSSVSSTTTLPPTKSRRTSSLQMTGRSSQSAATTAVADAPPPPPLQARETIIATRSPAPSQIAQVAEESKQGSILAPVRKSVPFKCPKGPRLLLTGVVFQALPLDDSFQVTQSKQDNVQSASIILTSLTRHLLSLYQRCNPQFNYQSQRNPKRILTRPCQGVHNDGYDNEDYDYILCVNDMLGSEEGRKYLILDILGQGTFGQVVKCINVKTKEQVAVKVIKNKTAYFTQSMMEVHILEMLNERYDRDDRHHITRMRDTFIFRKHLCIVFELLSVNLYELIKQNQYRGLSMNLVRLFMSQILDALCVLNEAKIIHCDLKPENILLKSLESPAIKVIDFGSACHEHQTVYTYIQSRFYRSPEVLLGLPYSSAIDIWSVGCIAAELFLGLPLFPGTSEYNQISRIVEMLGVPPLHMLEVGKHAHHFFTKTRDEATGERRYQLKSMQQYMQDMKNSTEQPSKRYFTATTLREIIRSYPMRKKNQSTKEVEEEMLQRESFYDFCHGLLNLNPIERWSPQQSRLHPFISGERFSAPYQPNKAIRYKAVATGSNALSLQQQQQVQQQQQQDSYEESQQQLQPRQARPRANTISSLSLANVPPQFARLHAVAAQHQQEQQQQVPIHQHQQQQQQQQLLPPPINTSLQSSQRFQQQQGALQMLSMPPNASLVANSQTPQTPYGAGWSDPYYFGNSNASNGAAGAAGIQVPMGVTAWPLNAAMSPSTPSGSMQMPAQMMLPPSALSQGAMPMQSFTLPAAASMPSNQPMLSSGQSMLPPSLLQQQQQQQQQQPLAMSTRLNAYMNQRRLSVQYAGQQAPYGSYVMPSNPSVSVTVNPNSVPSNEEQQWMQQVALQQAYALRKARSQSLTQNQLDSLRESNSSTTTSQQTLTQSSPAAAVGQRKSVHRSTHSDSGLLMEGIPQQQQSFPSPHDAILLQQQQQDAYSRRPVAADSYSSQNLSFNQRRSSAPSLYPPEWIQQVPVDSQGQPLWTYQQQQQYMQAVQRAAMPPPMPASGSSSSSAAAAAAAQRRRLSMQLLSTPPNNGFVFPVQRSGSFDQQQQHRLRSPLSQSVTGQDTTTSSLTSLPFMAQQPQQQPPQQPNVMTAASLTWPVRKGHVSSPLAQRTLSPQMATLHEESSHGHANNTNAAASQKDTPK